MAAGDLNWTDAGRTTKSQFFYHGLKGKRMVGRCGDNEVRTGLMVKTSYKMWTKLFKLIHKRDPHPSEINEAISTQSLGRDVARWEKIELVPPSERQLIADIKIRKSLRRQEKVLRLSLVEMQRRADEKAAEDKAQRDYEKSLEIEINTDLSTIKRAKPKRAKRAKKAIKKAPVIKKEDIAKLIEKGIDEDIICLALCITPEQFKAIVSG